jgi:CO dehydrogenase maturation factor
MSALFWGRLSNRENGQEVLMNKIAVCGKGGSGKSVIVRLLADGMRARGRRVLVVDSDESNTGLYRMLGFDSPPDPLIGLLGGKQKVEQEIEAEIKAGGSEETLELMRERAEMPVADIPPEYILETDGIKLVTIGKILLSLEGCSCPMGIVSRSFLKKLRLEADEIAIVDLEAGVEHFGRGVETSIDCVLVIVEPSLDSLEIAERIRNLSSQIYIADVWVILNKTTSEEIDARLTDYLDKKDISVIGSIRHNQEIFESCLEGRPIRGRVAAEEVDKILDFLFP